MHCGPICQWLEASRQHEIQEYRNERGGSLADREYPRSPESYCQLGQIIEP